MIRGCAFARREGAGPLPPLAPRREREKESERLVALTRGLGGLPRGLTPSNAKQRAMWCVTDPASQVWRYSFQLEKEAAAVEAACEEVLKHKAQNEHR